MAPSEQVTRKEPSGALSIDASTVCSFMEGTKTSFPIRKVNPFGPLTEFITTAPASNSAVYSYLPEKRTRLRGESLSEPFPLMLKVAEPDSPVRTLSPEKIVISAGAGEAFTYASPMLVREPKGSLSVSCGSTWARLNAGRSKRSATSGKRPIEVGLRVCLAAECGLG